VVFVENQWSMQSMWQSIWQKWLEAPNWIQVTFYFLGLFFTL
jgi:hypothetical protein